MTNFDARVRFKKDSKENWDSNDIVLLDGELGLSVENGKIRAKIGDGILKYSELPYQFDSIPEIATSVIIFGDDVDDAQATTGKAWMTNLPAANGAINESYTVANNRLANGTYSCVVRIKLGSLNLSDEQEVLRLSMTMGETEIGQGIVLANDLYQNNGYCTLSFPVYYEKSYTEGDSFVLNVQNLYGAEQSLYIDYVTLQLAGISLLSL